jgi:DNA polymerase
VKLYFDTETFNDLPITVGTYRYVETCELMLVTWALDNDEPQAWDLTADEPMPFELVEAILLADEFVAHNAMFDRLVFDKHLAPRVKRAISREHWRCTMVKALCHSLPGGLGKLCDILKVDADKAKIKDGKELIQLFCKPRPKSMKLRRATRLTHPAEWSRFVDYAKADISAMREVDAKLPSWNYGREGEAAQRELALWHLDQQINDRGFEADVDLATAALAAADNEQIILAQQSYEMTNGEVAKATQRDALLAHILVEYGIALPDLKGSTLERRLDDPDIPYGLKELLRVRIAASTTSISKYKRIINGVTSDGRMKGTLQFAGAGRTCRWAGRTFQPQNLKRPTLAAEEIDYAIEAIKGGFVHLYADNVMDACSNAMRGVIVAPRGKKLCVADLSNIEGRDQAWLAGEEWKLQAFHNFDIIVGEDEKGNPLRLGPDLYKLAYSKSFGIKPEDVDKGQRQIGKVQELALGYQGRVGAFITFCLAYSIDIEQMARDAYDHIPAETMYEAGGFYDWCVKMKMPTFGISREAFCVCDSFARLWREAHSRIASYWPELENAALNAIDSPGSTIQCRKLKVRRDGAWLRIGLPSGRALCYPQPRITANKLSYMGVNQYTRQWNRINTYGGKLFENCCQGVARDVMAWNMPAIEQAGYKQILTVHDEVITETPDSKDYSAEGLSALLAANPPWALDMPLAAAGFEAYRYRKD